MKLPTKCSYCRSNPGEVRQLEGVPCSVFACPTCYRVLNDARVFSSCTGVVLARAGEIPMLLSDEKKSFFAKHKGFALNYVDIQDIGSLLRMLSPNAFAEIPEQLETYPRQEAAEPSSFDADTWDVVVSLPDALIALLASIRRHAGEWHLDGHGDKERVGSDGAPDVPTMGKDLADAMHFNGGIDRFYGQLARLCRKAVKENLPVCLLENHYYNDV